jgi:hypothetical protein
MFQSTVTLDYLLCRYYNPDLRAELRELVYAIVEFVDIYLFKGLALVIAPSLLSCLALFKPSLAIISLS